MNLAYFEHACSPGPLPTMMGGVAMLYSHLLKHISLLLYMHFVMFALQSVFDIADTADVFK